MKYITIIIEIAVIMNGISIILITKRLDRLEKSVD